MMAIVLSNVGRKLIVVNPRLLVISLIRKISLISQRYLFNKTTNSINKSNNNSRVIVSNSTSVTPVEGVNMGNFEKALTIVLQYEGGYSDHPSDKGGKTNKGITQSVYDGYRSEKDLPTQSVEFIQDKEVSAIYYNKYWLKASCEKLPQRLAIVHFDTAVNSGVSRAIRFLQKSAGTTDDGVIGPATLSAVSSKDENYLIAKFIDKRSDFIVDIVLNNSSQIVFLKGWMRRIRNLERMANTFVA